MHDHADFRRKTDGRLTHAAFDVGVEILLAVAGKIDVDLTGAMSTVSLVRADREAKVPLAAPYRLSVPMERRC